MPESPHSDSSSNGSGSVALTLSSDSGGGGDTAEVAVALPEALAQAAGHAGCVAQDPDGTTGAGAIVHVDERLCASESDLASLAAAAAQAPSGGGGGVSRNGSSPALLAKADMQEEQQQLTAASGSAAGQAEGDPGESVGEAAAAAVAAVDAPAAVDAASGSPPIAGRVSSGGRLPSGALHGSVDSKGSAAVKPGPAVKSYSIQDPPQLLTLHLKRFEQARNVLSLPSLLYFNNTHFRLQTPGAGEVLARGHKPSASAAAAASAVMRWGPVEPEQASLQFCPKVRYTAAHSC